MFFSITSNPAKVAIVTKYDKWYKCLSHIQSHFHKHTSRIIPLSCPCFTALLQLPSKTNYSHKAINLAASSHFPSFPPLVISTVHRATGASFPFPVASHNRRCCLPRSFTTYHEATEHGEFEGPKRGGKLQLECHGNRKVSS